MELLGCGDDSSIRQQCTGEHLGTYSILALHSDGAFASNMARASFYLLSENIKADTASLPRKGSFHITRYPALYVALRTYAPTHHSHFCLKRRAMYETVKTTNPSPTSTQTLQSTPSSSPSPSQPDPSFPSPPPPRPHSSQSSQPFPHPQ